MDYEDTRTSKELLKEHIQAKIAQTNALDQIVAGKTVRNRPLYSRHETFSIVFEILLEATRAMGLVDFLERWYELSDDEKRMIERHIQAYQHLKRDVYEMYEAHVRNDIDRN